MYNIIKHVVSIIRITSMGIGLLLAQGCTSRVTNTNMGHVFSSPNQQPAVPKQVGLSANTLSRGLEMKTARESYIAIADFISTRYIYVAYGEISTPSVWPEEKILENSKLLITNLLNQDLEVLVNFLIKFREWPKEGVMGRVYTDIVESIATNARELMNRMPMKFGRGDQYLPLFDFASNFIGFSEENMIQEAYTAIAGIIDADAPTIRFCFKQFYNFVQAFRELPKENVVKKACIIISGAIKCCMNDPSGYTLQDLSGLANTFHIMYSENTDQTLESHLLHGFFEIACIIACHTDVNGLLLRSTPQNLSDLARAFTYSNLSTLWYVQMACAKIARHINGQDLGNYTLRNLASLARIFGRCLMVKQKVKTTPRDKKMVDEMVRRYHKVFKEAYAKIASHIYSQGLSYMSEEAFYDVAEAFSECPDVAELFKEICIKMACLKSIK